ncbi:MAG: hypothetical protein K2Q10_13865 [Rhodospirillales bacterium]|nr:hypothetical protein [Rhodospirillales bacterium]
MENSGDDFRDLIQRLESSLGYVDAVADRVGSKIAQLTEEKRQLQEEHDATVSDLNDLRARYDRLKVAAETVATRLDHLVSTLAPDIGQVSIGASLVAAAEQAEAKEPAQTEEDAELAQLEAELAAEEAKAAEGAAASAPQATESAFGEASTQPMAWQPSPAGV